MHTCIHAYYTLCIQLLCDDDDGDDDVVIAYRFHLSLYRVGISRSATQNVLPQCDRDTDPKGEH